jgi:hypothetical protein
MRLAAIACTLAIVVCALIFGAIFLQKASVPGAAPTPALAAPDERPVTPRTQIEVVVLGL